MIAPLVRVLVVALLLLVGAMLWVNRAQHRLPETATLVAATDPLPEVALTDDSGQARSSNEVFDGRYTLLFFGFTHCPDICPLTLQTLATVAETLRDSPQPPAVLFVSVDPERDTPHAIARYLATFDRDFEGATAPQDALQPLLQKLGVTVHIERGPDAQNYTVTHNATIYVVDPEARLAAVFGPPHDAHAIARDYERIRQLPQRLRRSTPSAP